MNGLIKKLINSNSEDIYLYDFEKTLGEEIKQYFLSLFSIIEENTDYSFISVEESDKICELISGYEDDNNVDIILKYFPDLSREELNEFQDFLDDTEGCLYIDTIILISDKSLIDIINYNHGNFEGLSRFIEIENDYYISYNKEDQNKSYMIRSDIDTLKETILEDIDTNPIIVLFRNMCLNYSSNVYDKLEEVKIPLFSKNENNNPLFISNDIDIESLNTSLLLS